MDRLTDWITVVLAGLVIFFITEDLLAADSPTIFDGKWYAEVGMGYNDSFFQSTERYMWEDAGSPGFYGSLRYELMLDRDRLGVVAYYTHFSQWFAGPPFNSRGESSLDSIGIAVRWRLDRD